MALQDDVRILASMPVLRDLEPDALRLIAFGAETRILRIGDVLFNKGDTSDAGFVLQTGALALETGLQQATTVRPPALIGASALIAETRRPATAVAREPSGVLRISRALFRRVLEEHPESAVRLRRSMAGALAELSGDLAALRVGITAGP